jgi:TPR repeat protein
MVTAIFLALLFIRFYAADLAAAGFEEGKQAMERGDYSTALNEWRPLAEQGDARAQANLGIMYKRGQGVPQDFKKAMDWALRAAEQGYPGAAGVIGSMY